MKVNKVQTIHQQKKNVQKAPAKTSQVNFGGRGNILAYADEVAKLDAFWPRFFTYVGEHDGEILNTAVTFFGTAAIAPLFIAFNPLSKEDKETKVYTAGRQPISACIAAGTQFYVNSKFNDWVDKKASTGGWGPDYDLTARPQNSYLNRLIKLEHPEYDKQQRKVEIEKRKVAIERRAIIEYRNNLKDANINFSELVYADSLGKKYNEVADEMRVLYADEIKNMSERKAKKFIKSKVNPTTVRRRALAAVQEAVEFEAKVKWEIRKLAKSGTPIAEHIEKFTNELKTAGENADKFTECVLRKLIKINEYETANKLTEYSSVTNLGKNYEEVLHNVKIKRLVRVRTANNKIRVGNANKFYGILISLATLPFSCGLLNWAYPRVMEKVMPLLQPWIHKNDPVKTAEVAETNNEVNVEDIEEDDDE